MNAPSPKARILLGSLAVILILLVVVPLLIAGSIWILAVLFVFLLLAVPVFLAMKRRSTNEKNDPAAKP